MAKNGPKGGGRKGAIRQRTQFKHPNGTSYKRDKNTGQIIDGKSTGGKFKGVRQENKSS